MNLDKVWVKDPANKGKPSVSLTLVIISVIFLLVTGMMQVLGKVETTGPFLEFMLSTFALYFGRRFKFSGKEFSSEKASKVKEKLEESEEG